MISKILFVNIHLQPEVFMCKVQAKVLITLNWKKKQYARY